MEYNYLPAELPTRAWEAFNAYKGDREVSLLLSVAWSAFVVPTERLDFLETNRGHHAGDSALKDGVPKQLIDSWIDKKNESISCLAKHEGIYTFTDREPLPAAGSSDWFGLMHKDTEPNPKPSYAELIAVMRHGLSHGNIWTDNKKSHVENLYIANYPPNSSKPVKVLRIQDCTLYGLVEDFVVWYNECIRTTEIKKLLASYKY